MTAFRQSTDQHYYVIPICSFSLSPRNHFVDTEEICLTGDAAIIVYQRRLSSCSVSMPLYTLSTRIKTLCMSAENIKTSMMCMCWPAVLRER